ncbi:MAG: hypothetical protein ACKOER_00525, partial [Betaproteobacteria bacterium]
MRSHAYPSVRLHAPLLACLAAVFTWGGIAHAASEPGPRWARGPALAVSEDPESARVIVKYTADSALRRVQSSALAEGAAAPAPRHAQRLSQTLRAPLTDGRVLGPHTQALRGQGLS